MKRISYGLLFILFSTFSYGQNYEVSLSSTSLLLIEKPLNIEKVIDARSDKSTIGFVQKGMANKKVNAVFEKSLEEEVLGFIRKSSRSDWDLPPVILKVNNVTISEHTSATSEKGKANVTVDFLIFSNDAYYKVMSRTGTSEVKGMDVTKKHPQNLALAFQKCFASLESIKFDDIDLSEFDKISEEELYSINVEQEVYQFDLAKYPKLSEEMKRGVYMSFEEFLNNSPSITSNFDIEITPRKNEAWQGTYSAKLTYADKGKKIKGAWGFCDGRVRRVFHELDFFDVKLDDSGCYFYGFGSTDTQHISTSAIVGGAIGGGLASASEISKAKKEKVKYVLNLDYGTIQVAE